MFNLPLLAAAQNPESVPTLALVFMGISLVLILAVPIVLFFYIKKRFKLNPRALLNGVLVYMAACMLLPQLISIGLAMIPGLGDTLKSNATLAGVVMGLVIAALQMAGLLLGAKYLMKNAGFGSYLFYGLGFTVLEAFMQTATNMFSYLSLAKSVNQVGTAQLIQEVQESNPEQSEEAVKALYDFIGAPAVNYLSYGLDSTLKVIFILCVAVLIYAVSKKIGPKYLTLLVLGFIFLFNVPNLLFQAGLYSSMWVAEAMYLVITAGCAYFTYRLVKGSMPDELKNLTRKIDKYTPPQKKFPKFNIPRD